MGDASFQQSSFLGGEWSPNYQGRIENPRYKTAMNVSLNGYPVEEGAWVKRSGTRLLHPPNIGAVTKLIPFTVDPDFPFVVELSAEALRITVSDQYVYDSVANLTSISAGTPVVIGVDAGASAWVTGDVVELVQANGDPLALGGLTAQQFQITVLSGGSISLHNPVTGADIDGSNIDLTSGLPTIQVGRILQLGSFYLAAQLERVQATLVRNSIFLFHKDVHTLVITMTNLDRVNPRLSTFEVDTTLVVRQDGPYFDAVTGQTALVSGISGSITVTLSGGFGPNQTVPTSTDVGRIMRLFSEPDTWINGTTYAPGDRVSFGGAYFYCLKSTAGHASDAPNNSPIYWAIDLSLAAWGWGFITAVLSPTQVTLLVVGDLIYNNTVNSWRLGMIGDPALGNPNSGAFHEGRLWVGLDHTLAATAVAATANIFTPTERDGTVTDANGITYTLEAGDEDRSTIQWLHSEGQGLIVGTTGGEWLVKASTLDDPITPTSIQARRVTKYRVAPIKPVKTPLALVFLQRFKRKMQELLPDVFTGKYVAPNLTTAAKHLTTKGLQEIAYQEETTPVLWSRDGDGVLLGTTYRRQSAFPTEEPVFTGWHRHTHGENARIFTSLCVSPSPNTGLGDSLYLVTKGGNSGSAYYVERMTKQFDEGDTMLSSFFLDRALVPVAMRDNGTSLTLYGLYNLAGQTVRAVVGGLNAGLVTISATGTVTIAYASPLTLAYLQGLPGTGYGEAGTTFSTYTDTTPTRASTPYLIGNFPGSNVDANGTDATFRTTRVSWDTNRMAVVNNNGDPTDGIVYSFDLAARTLVTSVHCDSFYTNPGTPRGGGCMTTDGFLLLQLGGASSSRLVKLSMSTLAVVGSMGSTTNFGGGPGVDVPAANSNAATFGGGAHWLSTIGASQATLTVINTDNMTFANHEISMETDTQQCRGRVGALSGSVFVVRPTASALLTLGEVSMGSGASTWGSGFDTWSSIVTYSLGDQVIYQGITYSSRTTNLNSAPTGVTSTDWTRLSNPGITYNTRGTISTAQVDAAGTNISCQDVGYDSSDGNVIALVSISGSPTHPHYLIKLNAATGAVVWKTPVGLASFLTGLNQARITGYRLGWTDGGGNLYALNTATGAISVTLSLTSSGGPGVVQFSDSVTGNFYTFFSYDHSASGAPTPISPTPNTFAGLGEIQPGNQLLAGSHTLTLGSVPAIVGFDYTARGQILRPGTPPDAGAQNGPPLGKTRRLHMFGALMRSSQYVSFGTDFTTVRAAAFKSPGGTSYTPLQLFSGVYWDTIESEYDFDGMLAWQSMGPYPLTIVSVSGFLHTQDR